MDAHAAEVVQYDSFQGWATNSMSMGYSYPPKSPCDVESYILQLPAGAGYYSDPGVTGGFYRTISNDKVNALRHTYTRGSPSWADHTTGVTCLPQTTTTTTTVAPTPPSQCPPGYQINERGFCRLLCTSADCSHHGDVGGFVPQCSCDCHTGWMGDVCGTEVCRGRCKRALDNRGLDCHVLGQGYNIFKSDPFANNDPGLVRRPLLSLADDKLCVEASDHSSSTKEGVSTKIKDATSFRAYVEGSFGGEHPLKGKGAEIIGSVDFGYDSSSEVTTWMSKAKCTTQHIGFL